MARQKSIARCVVRGITRDTSSEANKKSSIGRVLAAFAALFALYQVPLDKYKPEAFAKLRRDSWSIDEAGYVDSFITEDKKDGAALQTMGDMGFSGSVSASYTCPASTSVTDYRRHSSPLKISGISSSRFHVTLSTLSSAKISWILMLNT